MPDRSSIAAVALAAALTTSQAATLAADEFKFPDLKGQWARVGGPNWI